MRVVLAEIGSPGSIHYLLEAEGFQVVGCASDEQELERVLEQGVRPDVIVLDADVVATSALVARRHEPDAHVIVIWPDGVQPPRGAERVSPALVYEELGPAIRRHGEPETPREPIIVLPDAMVAPPAAIADVPSGGFGRTASRVSLTTVSLIAAIVLTMGVSFALARYDADRTARAARIAAPGASVSAAHQVDPDPAAGRNDMRTLAGTRPPRCPGSSHARAAASSCVARSDRVGRPTSRPHPQPVASHDTPDHSSGAVPPTDPGGGQGNGGSDPGDQGGSPGDQGNEDDQGQDEQGDGGNQDDQGSDEQGSNDQGGQGAQGDEHASQSDDQG